MFCESAGMQLSAANLLIAAQQLGRGAARPLPDAQAQFAGALAKEKGVEGAGFEPMEFRAAAPVKPAAPAAAPASPSNSGPVRLGSHVDIRV